MNELECRVSYLRFTYSDLDPFLRAFAFHYIAVAIHPFADGNGRTVRLTQHLLLLRGGQARYDSGVPRRTLERDLAAMVETKLLSPRGENKARTYSVRKTR